MGGRARPRQACGIPVRLAALLLVLLGLLLPQHVVTAAGTNDGTRGDSISAQQNALLVIGDGDVCANCSFHGQCTNDGGCKCELDYSWSANCSQTRSELLDWDAFYPYVITILCTYAVLDLVVICLLGYVISSSCLSFRFNVQSIAYVFLILAFSERIVYYSLDPGGINSTLDAWLDRFLQYFFYPLLFTSYTIVLYFWASSYLRASTGRSDVLKRLRLVFVLMNVVLYTVEVVICLLQAFLTNSSSSHDRERFTLLYQIYLAVILILISVAFLYYGVKIYSQLRKFTSMSYTGSRALRSVTILTTATAVCFLSGIISNMVILLLHSSNSTIFIINDAVTQGLCIIASILVLVLLGRPRRMRAAQAKNANVHEEDKVPFLGDERATPTADLRSDLEEPLFPPDY